MRKRPIIAVHFGRSHLSSSVALSVGCCLRGRPFIATVNKKPWTWRLSRANGPKRCSPSDNKVVKLFIQTEFLNRWKTHANPHTRIHITDKQILIFIATVTNLQSNKHIRTHQHKRTQFSSSHSTRLPACMNPEYSFVSIVFFILAHQRYDLGSEAEMARV